MKKSLLRQNNVSLLAANLALIFFMVFSFTYAMGTAMVPKAITDWLAGIFPGASEQYLGLIGVQLFIMLPAAAVGVAFMSGSKKKGLGISGKLKVSQIALLLVFSFGCIYFAQGINALLMSKLESFGYQTPATASIAAPNTLPELFFGIIAIGVFPALFEELLFRGVVYQGYRSISPGVAVIASAVFFGFMHGTPDQLVFAMVFGIFLALAVQITRSIWAGVIIHAANNIYTMVKVYASSKAPPEVPEAGLNIGGLVILIFVGLIVALGAIEGLRSLSKKSENEFLPAQGHYSAAAFLPAVLFILLCILNVYVVLRQGFGLI